MVLGLVVLGMVLVMEVGVVTSVVVVLLVLVSTEVYSGDALNTGVRIENRMKVAMCSM